MYIIFLDTLAICIISGLATSSITPSACHPFPSAVFSRQVNFSNKHCHSRSIRRVISTTNIRMNDISDHTLNIVVIITYYLPSGRQRGLIPRPNKLLTRKQTKRAASMTNDDREHVSWTINLGPGHTLIQLMVFYFEKKRQPSFQRGIFAHPQVVIRKRDRIVGPL